MLATLPQAAAPPLVGPNAILQVLDVATERFGPLATRQLFRAGGVLHHWDAPPEHMTPENDAAALHSALFALYPREAPALSAEAGRRTADYLLAHRIPKPAQWLLRALPARTAGGLLLKAIAKHAWTFAGSGRVRTEVGEGFIVEIAHNPLAQPDCPWHAAVFERLFRALVSPDAQVLHTHCCFWGDEACRFEVYV
jgi:divinyl protochlorophyllide a 8-vinyl-reductase